MATLSELARFFTRLEADAVAHLQRLVASWGLLADFCFADLLLFGVVGDTREGGTNRFVVLGQVRPTTSQTVYRADWVGTVLEEADRPLVARAYRLGEIIEGEMVISPLKERVRVLCIPIRYRGRVVGVLTRESAPAFGRQPGELERTYVDVFNRFARMISSGDFPFDGDDAESEEAPRVGDGAIVLDSSGRVEYTSPNAVSTLHRLGVHANAEGLRFSELGLEETVVRTAFNTGTPATEELSRGVDITVLIRGIPLLDQGAVTGAVVLLRDISELRRRDLLLLSKDATIREIHHRVKNNLQTISSLLRLQGRRLAQGEAKDAIEESVRRIRSIALGARDPVSGGGRRRAVRRHREARGGDGGRQHDLAGASHPLRGRRRRRHPSGRRRHPAGGGAQRVAPERRGPRVSAGARSHRHARPGTGGDRTGRADVAPRGGRRRRGPATRDSSSTSPQAWACRSCGPW